MDYVFWQGQIFSRLVCIYYSAGGMTPGSGSDKGRQILRWMRTW